MIQRITVLLAALAFASAAGAQSISTYVAAPDGVLLATDVYLTWAFAPTPTVLIRTTYDKNDVGPACLVFNTLGFSCVAQDTRGLYGSEGVDTVFRDDGPDGRATVAWITDQWWSDGAVATVGPSALGIVQYALAPGAPDGLRCMMPIVATPDVYHHAFIQGGCLRESLITNWLEGQGSLAFLEEILEHRLWDGWWQEVDPLAAPQSVQAPTLHVGGWYDIFQQGTLDGFTAYQYGGGDGAIGRQYLVMGPWTHTGVGRNISGELVYPANATFDIVDATEGWLEMCLKGRSDDVERWPPVRIYLMGAVGENKAPGNIWLGLNDWPPLALVTPLHLTADGVLGPRPAPEGHVNLHIDPNDPVPTLGGANLFPDVMVDGRQMGTGPMDQRSVEVRDDVLVFSTGVLERPVTVIGRVSCRLWINADTPDLDLSVRLSDVYPDGRSMLVLDGIQRARMRCGDRQECFLEPGEPTEIEVDLWSTAIVFNAGHRIRISVAGSNAPRFEVNPNDGGDLDSGTPIIAVPTLLFGPDHPSSLDLPVIPGPRRPSGRISTTP